MQQHIISELRTNQKVFEALLTDVPKEMITWKQAPEKWCLLEIVCHLYDEEREDFRNRLRTVLETPGTQPSPIDPEGWVTARNYMSKDFGEMVNSFLEERESSLNWLTTLKEPDLTSFYEHPKFGKLTAKMFLSEWLSHDHLHIRQITKLKYGYNRQLAGNVLPYAGDW